MTKYPGWIFAAAIISGAAVVDPALAGDGAAFQPLGFSSDARTFAFEQYGVADGSGFPYSSIHIVDTGTNREIAGSPFKAEAEDDSNRNARADATEAAKPALDRLGIADRLTVLALGGMSAPFEELTPMDVRPALARETSELRFWSSPLGGEAVLRLEQPAAPKGKCDTMQESGTVLPVLKLQRGVGAVDVIFADDADPMAFGCPSRYGLVAAYLDEGEKVLVTVLSTYPLGFEGPDRRFRAVAWTIDDKPKPQ